MTHIGGIRNKKCKKISVFCNCYTINELLHVFTATMFKLIFSKLKAALTESLFLGFNRMSQQEMTQAGSTGAEIFLSTNPHQQDATVEWKRERKRRPKNTVKCPPAPLRRRVMRHRLGFAAHQRFAGHKMRQPLNVWRGTDPFPGFYESRVNTD